MKTFALKALIAAGLALSTTTAMAMDDATKAALASCQDPKTEALKGAGACTTVLNNVKMGPKNSLAIHYYRGAFYSTASKSDKALEDFTAAIDAYEKDPDKANWPVDFVGLAASSYSFRAQLEQAAKKCDAARKDYQSAAATSREVSERADYEKRARDACR